MEIKQLIYLFNTVGQIKIATEQKFMHLAMFVKKKQLAVGMKIIRLVGERFDLNLDDFKFISSLKQEKRFLLM